MTLALLALAALVVAFLVYRLARLPAALRAARSMPQALMSEPEPVAPTGHMVLQYAPHTFNEHGFITTPVVPCIDPACHCRNPERILT